MGILVWGTKIYLPLYYNEIRFLLKVSIVLGRVSGTRDGDLHAGHVLRNNTVRE